MRIWSQLIHWSGSQYGLSMAFDENCLCATTRRTFRVWQHSTIPWSLSLSQLFPQWTGGRVFQKSLLLRWNITSWKWTLIEPCCWKWDTCYYRISICNTSLGISICNTPLGMGSIEKSNKISTIVEGFITSGWQYWGSKMQDIHGCITRSRRFG